MTKYTEWVVGPTRPALKTRVKKPYSRFLNAQAIRRFQSKYTVVRNAVLKVMREHQPNPGTET